jgi:hypothetical protein
LQYSASSPSIQEFKKFSALQRMHAELGENFLLSKPQVERPLGQVLPISAGLALDDGGGSVRCLVHGPV